MQTRIRNANASAPAALLIPLLEADDLPGDEDWTLLNGFAHDEDDAREVSFHPDFD